MTIPNTLKYLITNPATRAPQLSKQIITQHFMEGRNLLNDSKGVLRYDFIVLIFVCFFFLLQGFGFNLQIVIYGIFNFLVYESEWTGQRA